MNVIRNKHIIFAFLTLIVFNGCRKDEEFSVIPEIEFMSFTKIKMNNIDYQGVLEFSFKDKDGDIGLRKEDTLPPYDFNLYLTYFEKVNGEFVEYEFPDTTIPTHARIPYLTPEGQNKTIKGVIQDTIFINDFDTTNVFDTLRFEFYILDRALHKSNVVVTPEILVKKK